MKEFVCVGDYRNGAFETDSIGVRTTKGGFRSVWLHYDNKARGFTEEELNQFWTIVAKFERAYVNFNYRLKRETHLRLKGEMAKRFGVGGVYSFFVALTAAELNLIDRMSDQSNTKRR